MVPRLKLRYRLAARMEEMDLQPTRGRHAKTGPRCRIWLLPIGGTASFEERKYIAHRRRIYTSGAVSGIRTGAQIYAARST